MLKSKEEYLGFYNVCVYVDVYANTFGFYIVYYYVLHIWIYAI